MAFSHNIKRFDIFVLIEHKRGKYSEEPTHHFTTRTYNIWKFEYGKCSKISNTNCPQNSLDQSADFDQTASYLFAILTGLLRIPTLKTNIFHKNKLIKVFEI